jgi:condensin complex subunit 2
MIISSYEKEPLPDSPIFNDAESDDDVFTDALLSMSPSTGNDMVVLHGGLLVSLKTVEKQYIHYAKTAKRVDVKQLKENLWKTLTFSSEDQAVSERFLGERKFTTLIHQLRYLYSESQFKDISIAFCFICLLHLANEKHLTITGRTDMRDLIISQN